MYLRRRRRATTKPRISRYGWHGMSKEQLETVPHYKRLIAAGVAQATALADTRKLMETDPALALRVL